MDLVWWVWWHMLASPALQRLRQDRVKGSVSYSMRACFKTKDEDGKDNIDYNYPSASLRPLYARHGFWGWGCSVGGVFA